MHVIVNGDKHEIPAGSSIATLLEKLGLGQAACAVEVNKTLVPKRAHGEKSLADGDRLEIVTLVGGG